MQTKNNFTELNEYLIQKKSLVEEKLKFYLRKNQKVSQELWESIEYSLFAGGKRLRPILTIAVSEIFSINNELILPTACAIEMIHTQSLIHDDLPAMDDDDLRRGKPTNHKVFGEDISIIAGDALLAYAFHVITRDTSSEINRNDLLKVIMEISEASGPNGMCGGQALDVRNENNPNLDSDLLNLIHNNKTGAMIRVSIRSGAILSRSNETELELLTNYADNLGLAFQIIDDVLDVTGETEKLGKKIGHDINKLTYPKIYGLEKSKDIAKEKIETAINSLEIFGKKAKYLKLLAEFTLNRQY